MNGRKFSNWMMNRYGLDTLSYGVLVTFGLIAIANMFLKSRAVSYGSMLLILYVFFRLMSKDKVKRSTENRLFEHYLGKIKASLKLELRKLKEFHTHRFRTCPNCKTVMRLKRKTGNHTVECPKCHKEMTVKILF